MVRAPITGSTMVDLIDRRSGATWVVEVEPFDISATVVTRRQWGELMSGAGEPEGADLPAVEVSWRDAITFCNRLSEQTGRTPAYDVQVLPVEARPGWTPYDRPAPDDWIVRWRREADGFRLPTEAEWQLACRAGTAGPHYGPLDEIAWYADNSGGALPAVGQKAPNAWGLYDMLGGVWEWCWDLFDPEVYGAYRVIRGGGWADRAWSCRAGVRRKTQPTVRLDDLGIRLVRSAGAPS